MGAITFSRAIGRLRKALSYGRRCITANTPYRRSARAFGLAVLPGRLVLPRDIRRAGGVRKLLGLDIRRLAKEALIQITFPGGEKLFTPATADDRDDWIRCWELLYDHWLECCVLDQYYFADLIEPNMTVLDVGANVGAAAIAASRWLGEEGIIVAIEPVPSNVTALRHCISANNLPVAHLMPIAMGSADAQVTIYCGRNRTGVHTTAPTRASSGAQELDVEQRAIDSLMAELQIAPDFIKIDVEGAELDLLAGASRTLKQCRPIVVAAAYHEPEHPASSRGSSRAQCLTIAVSCDVLHTEPREGDQ